MDDAEIVAAIAAGELDGLSAALDRYAVSLFDYCYSLAPEAAVDAVHDTFIVAWCKLDALTDPASLYSWLETVAGNECFRRTLTDGGPDRTQPADVLPPAVMPAGLPARVVSECADETPAGRALKVWVTNRAGPFGRDGFPAAQLGRRGYLTGRRRIAVAVAAAAVLAVASAASAALMSSGGPRHDAAAAMGPGTGTGTSGSAPTSGASLPSTPASPIWPATGSAPHSQASRTSHGSAQQGAMGPGANMGEVQTAPPAVTAATMPPSAMASAPPPLTSAPPPPAQGFIMVSPPQLVLNVGGGNGAAAKTFMITAQNGPVDGYTIAIPQGLPGTLTVSPSSGSLAAGDSVSITVAADSTVAFTTDLTIYPGNIAVQVTVKVHGNQGNQGSQD